MDAALALGDYFFQKTARRKEHALPRPENASDAALVARARDGDAGAFEILLTRHRERVLKLAFQLLRDRDEAEDVAQDAFASAFDNLKTFRGEAQFSTWIYRITFNLCVHRKRRARPAETFDETQHGARGEDGALTKMMVEETLQQLSPPLRAALVLREMHDLSYEEIAEVLRIPVGTVRSRLNEARRQFRAFWDDFEDSPQRRQDTKK